MTHRTDSRFNLSRTISDIQVFRQSETGRLKQMVLPSCRSALFLLPLFRWAKLLSPCQIPQRLAVLNVQTIQSRLSQQKFNGRALRLSICPPTGSFRRSESRASAQKMVRSHPHRDTVERITRIKINRRNVVQVTPEAKTKESLIFSNLLINGLTVHLK